MRAGVHLSFMVDEARNRRLRVTRRDDPDLGKLIEWVLGIADARHRAWVAGEADPFGLPPPDGLAESPSAFGLSGVRERIETKHHSGKEANHEHRHQRRIRLA